MSSKKSKHLGTGGKTNSALLKKSYKLRSAVSSERVLRSRSHEKSKKPVSGCNPANICSEHVVAQRKGGKRKKKEKKKEDEYSRIRSRIRYLLNRINYEQSLITAYSSEGWKGLSLEKLKPEKELQRATKEILSRELKIRDLFQHLDKLSAEGRLPESLFDSEGEISGEDIFCAKCGSKDLSADNDIILCDGVCDRGFHQYCLEPPLLKEHIPPDDEGWLCPGCDCKVDCIDLLNDFRGTNLSLTDSWEKVFPEAAAAGDNQDHDFGLPSDESDDDDYNPDGPDDNKDNKNNDDDDDIDDESDQQEDKDESSVDSDFTSAFDKMVGQSKDEQYMGLPSDDSEDDDYDPGLIDNDDQVKRESSSSDLISDSEDLVAVLEDNECYRKEEAPLPGNSFSQKSQLHGRKKQPLNDGLSNFHSDPCPDGSTAVPKRQSIERLDYKMLYSETYGNVPSSSSDDEDWADRERSAGEGDSLSADENAIENERGRNNSCLKQSIEVNERTCMRKSIQKSKGEDTNTSGNFSKEHSTERRGSSAHRLEGAITQRLLKAFQQNRYPDRATKEDLAREVEIPYRKVDNWFAEKRRSIKRLSSSNGTIPFSVSRVDEDWADTEKTSREGGSASANDNAAENDSETNAKLLKQPTEANEQTLMRKSNRKSKGEDKNTSHEWATKCSAEGSGSSAHGLGGAVTQRLLKSFQENRYPDRPAKVNLAGELEIPYEKVDNWFRKARVRVKPSSSKDSQDWTNQKKTARKSDSVLTDEKANDNESERKNKPLKQCMDANACTATRKSGRKLRGKDNKHTSYEWSAKSSHGERKGSSANGLGGAVTQRLLKAFEENRYPDKATKENLASELEIPYQKVENWFGKRHGSVSGSSSYGTLVSSVSKGITNKIKTKDSTGANCQNEAAAACCHGNVRVAALAVPPKRSTRKPTAQQSQKRKRS